MNLPTIAEPPMVAEMPVQLSVVAVPTLVAVPVYGCGNEAPPPELSGMEVVFAEIPLAKVEFALSLVAAANGVRDMEGGA
jgi:hypothetical protein